MTLIYVVTFMVLSLPEGYRLVIDTFTNPRFVPYLRWYSVSVGLSGAGILVGGLLRIPHHPSGRVNDV
jgi:hypothetical protein